MHLIHFESEVWPIYMVHSNKWSMLP